jgi:hypothetical protein
MDFLTTTNMQKTALSISKIFTKKQIKTAVEGLPFIITGHVFHDMIDLVIF